jgi:hypothetical protein
MNVKYKRFGYDELIPGEGWFSHSTFKYPNMNDLLKAAADFASTIEPHRLINICNNIEQVNDAIRNRIVVTVWYWDNL